MIVYFVRHGQTDHNLQGIIQGQLDTPLNDTGRAESALLAAHLKDIPFAEVWSSSLCRATETAEILIGTRDDLVVRTDPGLMERDLGSLSGYRWVPGLTRHNLPHDVESRPVFKKRVSEWAEGFFASHKGAKGPILVVSHGAYLTALISVLVAPPFNFYTNGVDLDAHCLNTCVMRVRVECNSKGEIEGTVLSWGEVDHLQEGNRLRIADDLKTV